MIHSGPQNCSVRTRSQSHHRSSRSPSEHRRERKHGHQSDGDSRERDAEATSHASRHSSHGHDSSKRRRTEREKHEHRSPSIADEEDGHLVVKPGQILGHRCNVPLHFRTHSSLDLRPFVPIILAYISILFLSQAFFPICQPVPPSSDHSHPPITEPFNFRADEVLSLLGEGTFGRVLEVKECHRCALYPITSIRCLLF